jgi:hypothetical protein
MTQDEIVEMARQVGFWKDLFAYPEFKEHIEAFAKLVAAKECEACALICDGFVNRTEDNYSDLCAKAIRTRGEA